MEWDIEDAVDRENRVHSSDQCQFTDTNIRLKQKKYSNHIVISVDLHLWKYKMDHSNTLMQLQNIQMKLHIILAPTIQINQATTHLQNKMLAQFQDKKKGIITSDLQEQLK